MQRACSTFFSCLFQNEKNEITLEMEKTKAKQSIFILFAWEEEYPMRTLDNLWFQIERKMFSPEL